MVPDTTANSIGTAFDSAIFAHEQGINVIYAAGGALSTYPSPQGFASKEQGSTPRYRACQEASLELSVLHLSQVAGHVQ
jgi:hypothetical protein